MKTYKCTCSAKLLIVSLVEFAMPGRPGVLAENRYRDPEASQCESQIQIGFTRNTMCSWRKRIAQRVWACIVSRGSRSEWYVVGQMGFREGVDDRR